MRASRKQLCTVGEQKMDVKINHQLPERNNPRQKIKWPFLTTVRAASFRSTMQMQTEMLEQADNLTVCKKETRKTIKWRNTGLFVPLYINSECNKKSLLLLLPRLMLQQHNTDARSAEVATHTHAHKEARSEKQSHANIQ